MSAKRTVAFGPWVGELGWMISTWAPAVRRYARGNPSSDIVVVVPSGLSAIVSDITDKVVTFEHHGKSDRWLCDGHKAKPIEMRFPIDKWHTPNEDMCTKWPREFYSYRSQYFGKLRNAPSLVIHARGITRYNSGDRNWVVGNYLNLLMELGNPPAASIGHPDGAYHIPGTKDMRSTDISIAMYALCNTKVCIGPSSGPMHLASHCICPHVVWTTDKWQKSIKGTNRDRYENVWNHFNTPVTVIDKYGWQPPVHAVANVVRRYL